MIRSVPLHQLPEDIEFPPELRDRIMYDPKGKHLAFDGYMSKTHFDKLSRLHRNDEYRRAVEKLFQICEFEYEDEGRKPLRKVISVTVGVFVLAAGLCSLLLLVF